MLQKEQTIVNIQTVLMTKMRILEIHLISIR